VTVPRSQWDRAVFIDSSAFYALLDRSDRHHDAARPVFADVAREHRPLATSNLIVAETYVLLRRGLGHAIATRWLASLDLNLLFHTESDHQPTCTILARYEDKRFSYTDAASFVLMERFEIPTALTFDSDFRQYGLAAIP
jgi:predicted nucleic acid-binding protein